MTRILVGRKGMLIALALALGGGQIARATDAPPTASPAAMQVATSRTAPSQEQPAVYSFDKRLYVRLHVTLTYGDAKDPIDLNGPCPTGTLWDGRTTMNDILQASQTVNLGFAITSPTGQIIQMTPVQIVIEKHFYGTKCTVHIQQINYPSPIYSLFANPTGQFYVEPALYIRRKPTSDFIHLTSIAVTALTKIAGAPAPVALTIGSTIGTTLDGSGPNETSSVGVPLVFAPRVGHPEDRTSAIWNAETGIANAKLLTIHADLENVGTLFDPTNTTVSSSLFSAERYDDVLSATFLGDFGSGTLRTIENLVEYATADSNDLRTFNAQQLAVNADAPCDNIYRKLGVEGVSPTDRALIVWAEGRAQPLIGDSIDPTKNLDQISCIHNRESVLKTVGVDLRSSKSDQAKFNPGKEQMQFITDVNRAFARALVTPDPMKRSLYARSVFADKPSFSDQSLDVFSSTGMSLDNNDQWGYFLPAKSPTFLSRVGCYAYFPSNVTAPVAIPASGNMPSFFWAIGLTNDNREVAIRAVFEPSADAYPRIAKLEISHVLSAADQDAIQSKRGSAQCGDDDPWSPHLLFG